MTLSLSVPTEELDERVGNYVINSITCMKRVKQGTTVKGLKNKAIEFRIQESQTIDNRYDHDTLTADRRSSWVRSQAPVM